MNRWMLLFLPLALAAQEPARPKILGLAHVALFVSDLEKSRAFYKDFLGYGEPFSLDTLTFIKVNDRQYIELFPGLKPEQDRLNHISFYTDDAEGMRRYLASKGVKVPDRVPKGRIRNSNFNIKDPDGHTVEIVQYEPDGWSMREKGKFLGESRVSTRMLHTGILVGDLGRAAEFYGGILGFSEFWRGSRDGKVLSWVNMRVPDGSDYIEFMLYQDLPAGDKRGVQHHICLEAPDLAKAVSSLQGRGGYSRAIEARVGTNRRRQANLYDPDGTRVELMEPVTVDGTPTPPSSAPPPR
jgi:catechol 2,3-dioxygenase-like lactoylglutathione lyase family enzyme